MELVEDHLEAVLTSENAILKLINELFDSDLNLKENHFEPLLKLVLKKS